VIKRRKLMIALGASALAPVCAVAQTGKRRPIVGVVRVNPRDTNETFIEPFRRDMAALGWIEHDNVEFLFSWAGGRNAALAPLIADMVARKVDVIVTFGPVGARAALEATTVIPIVAMTDDLAGSGLVKSMARPGANLTGVSILATELDSKRLEILHEAVPSVRRVGVLYDPGLVRSMPAIKGAAPRLGIEIALAAGQTEAEIAEAIKTLIREKVGAVNVLASANLNAFRAFQIAEFARARFPAIYEWPETAELGGLLGYGPRNTAVYRQVAELVNKILRGAKPADLPVEQPTKFELVINLKTAKALGVSIPQSVMLRADKVIE
jgi:putative tryptophan/tyrosine transport system substrate-binding protein